jgi:hypothetical protein
MLLSECDVNRILVEADNSAITLRQLYQLYKSQHKKVSFSFLCRRCGIPSKGYLSFVMSGKRRLNAKYWAPVCDAFKLNYQQAEVMRLLLEADAEPEKRLLFDERMQLLRSQLPC